MTEERKSDYMSWHRPDLYNVPPSGLERVPGHASACHIHGGLACDRLPGCLQDGV